MNKFMHVEGYQIQRLTVMLGGVDVAFSRHQQYIHNQKCVLQSGQQVALIFVDKFVRVG